MIVLDISDSYYKNIFRHEEFHLPIRWDGRDFAATLKNLLDSYCQTLSSTLPYGGEKDAIIKQTKFVCRYLIRAVEHYLNGFPSKAYNSISGAMEKLMDQPLYVYPKDVENNTLDLFRAACVSDNLPYPRERLFHTPYSMRAKTATNRYSISGYPSLYLGTSLNLCCEEVNYSRQRTLGICSRFKINCRSRSYADHIDINVIELAVKPQDLLPEPVFEGQIGRTFRGGQLESKSVRSAYLLWYPLIAACSYIRVNKKDPFAAEYIIPQLLMQWVRSRMAPPWRGSSANKTSRLIGIRYFSCASQRASDMGFNYVFPTSGEKGLFSPDYCPVLANTFQLTAPRYLHEYKNISACENALRAANDFDYIASF